MERWIREQTTSENLCRPKPPSVMDCRAVITFLCLFSAQAACGPVKNGALNATARQMREDISSALGHLAAPGLLPNISSVPLVTTELLGTKEQPFSVRHLSAFRCLMLKLSELTPKLSPQLLVISQHTQDMELLSGQTFNGSCSLPTFEQHMDSYVYVKRLLELLDQQLSSAKF